MDIQWYPGHMAKATRLLGEDLRLIDVVVELVDARAPASTRNPDFDAMFSGKARAVLLNKSDLADPASNARWLDHYRAQGLPAAEVVSTANSSKKQVTAIIERAAAPRVAQMRAKGVNKVVRAMIVGIPNVGKSTLINRIAGQTRAKTSDKPGVTRAKQWVRITPYLELLDTPGLLWPKLADQAQARHLAFIGSVRDEILDAEQLAASLLLALTRLSPAQVAGRYKLITPEADSDEMLRQAALSRGFLIAGGAPDTERAARIVLDEYRAGRIGRFTLEQPAEANP